MRSAPPAENEAERLQALRHYEVIDTDAEASFDEITALASRLTGTPIALISLVDETRQWFKSRVGLSASETPRDIAFCSHAILGSDVLVVPDTRLDPRFEDNPLVLGDPFIRFYAGAPLVTAEGFRLGTLCVIDRKPRQLAPSERAFLEILSRQVVTQLDLRWALSQARNAETALHSIFTHMRDIYYRTDLAGTIRAVSPSVERYGYSTEELVNRDAAVLLADRDGLLGAIAESGTVDDLEIELRRKDGLTVPFSANAHLLTDDQNRPVGTEGLLRDIGTRKRAEQQRADFMAMVTHDIRGPLHNILGFLEIVPEEDKLSSALAEILPAIERNAATLLSLVANYLDVSKIESGNLDLRTHAIVLNDLLARVSEAHRGAMAGRDIDVVLDLDPDLPAIEVDPLAMERVFGNLVQNAMKALADGGRITVRSSRRGAHAVVEVVDSGPGIAADQLPSLFQLYRQTRLSRPQPGTGLGLFIVRSLVEAHGGTVEVASTPGVGTAFVVTLPISSATAA